jgi:hypothetical protein
MIIIILITIPFINHILYISTVNEKTGLNILETNQC